MRISMIKRLFSVLLTLTMIFAVVSPVRARAGESSSGYSGGQDLPPVPSDIKADSELLEEQFVPFDDYSDGVGIDELGEMSRVPANGRAADEVRYARGLAGDFTQSIGLFGLEGRDGDEVITAFVWLQELPGAIADVYASENMSVQGYSQASGDANSARQMIRRMGAQRTRSGADLTINYEYFEVFAGFSVTAKKSKLQEIADIPGVYLVKEVEEVVKHYVADPDYEVMGNAAGREYFNIGDIHAMGIDGAGVKVGVIDSGIDTDHPDLADIYKGGYDFTKNSSNMDSPDDDHGTHVSGTIASQGNGSLGVAPGVELYMAQIFREGVSTTSDMIVYAQEAFSGADGHRSGLPKVDVVNMSLGSKVNTAYTEQEVATNALVMAGVVCVRSAGNSGYYEVAEIANTHRVPYTVGSAGTASLALTVGSAKPGSVEPMLYEDAEASNGSLTETVPLMFEYSPLYRYAVVSDRWDNRNLVFDEANGGYELYFCLTGTPTLDYTVTTAEMLSAIPSGSLRGKILVVGRGIDFVLYQTEAMRVGAGGLIIINRDPAYITNVLKDNRSAEYLAILSAPSSTAEAFSRLSGGDDENFIGETKVYLAPGLLTRPEVPKEPSSFSSIGPVQETGEIKPDIIAPGDSILSTVLNGKYGLMPGTSMSSPFVAGVAALLIQAEREADGTDAFDPYEIKARIMNTADPYDLQAHSTNRDANYDDPIELSNAEPFYNNMDGDQISVFEQGAGSVMPLRAVQETLDDKPFITVSDMIPTGNPDKSTQEGTMSGFSFRNQLAGTTSHKLTATVNMFDGSLDPGDIAVSYNDDTRFSNDHTGYVTANITDVTANSFSLSLDIATDAPSNVTDGNLFEGYVTVTIDGGDYILPWAVRVGEAPIPRTERFLLYPDRPVLSTAFETLATPGNINDAMYQHISPQSQQNVFYFQFAGTEVMDKVKLRQVGDEYILDIVYLDADTDVPVYSFSVVLGTQPKLTDYIGGLNAWFNMFDLTSQMLIEPYVMGRYDSSADEWIYAAPREYLQGVTPGAYHLALELENKEGGTDYVWNEAMGMVYTEDLPVLTISNVLTSSAHGGLPDEYGDLDITMDNGKTLGLYAPGDTAYTIEGRIYSEAIEEAKEHGFLWAGGHLTYEGRALPISQAINGLADSSAEGLTQFLTGSDGKSALPDDDGYFTMTVPVSSVQGDIGGYDYLLDFSADEAYSPTPYDLAGGGRHTVFGVEAIEQCFSFEGSVQIGYYYYGSKASYRWTPHVREAVVPNITAEELPHGEVGETYGFELGFLGDPSISGDTPYRWSIQGDLPQGLSFGDGVISGTPEEAGEYSFTVTLETQWGSDTESFTLNVLGQFIVSVRSAGAYTEVRNEDGLQTNAFEKGDMVYAEAGEAPAGSEFREWTATPAIDGFSGSATESASFEMPGHDVEIMPVFAIPEAVLEGISVFPAEVTLAPDGGQPFVFRVRPEGTNNPSFTDTVVWEIDGDTGSDIDEGGVLTVGAEVDGTVITVTAATVVDGVAVSDTARVYISDDAVSYQADSLDITPYETAIEPGGGQQFTATVTGGGAVSQAVSWSVSGATDSSMTDGYLTVGEDESSDRITVIAVPDNDPSVKGEAYATVLIPRLAGSFIPVVNVKLNSGSVEANGTSISADTLGSVIPSNASNKDIIWEITNDGGTGVVLENGSLVFGDEWVAGTLTLRATVRGGINGGIGDFVKGGIRLEVIQQSADKFTVTFDGNGGSPSEQYVSVPAGSPVGDGLPIASRSGYTFRSWNTDNNGQGTVFTAATPVTGNITVYAMWRSNKPDNNNGNDDSRSDSRPSSPRNTSTSADLPESAEDKQTVPVNEGAVSIGYSVVEKDGLILDFMREAIELAVKTTTGTVSINLSGITGADMVTLPKDLLTAAVSANTSLTIAFDGVTAELSQSAMQRISMVSAGQKITIALEETYNSLLSPEAGGDADAGKTYELIIYDGVKYTKDFEGTIRISMLYTPDTGEDTSRTVVYVIEPGGTLSVITNSFYDADTGVLSFRTHRTGFYAVGQGSVSFTDIEDHWARENISQACVRGLITGYPDGEFKPDSAVTRAEFAQMVYAALETPYSGVGVPYDDVKDGDWYYKPVSALEGMSLLKGFGGSDGRMSFKPNDPITRGEMSVILGNLAQVKEIKAVNNVKASGFTDYADMGAYADSVERAVNSGFLNADGMGGGFFDPAGYMTRGQSATIQMLIIRAVN